MLFHLDAFKLVSLNRDFNTIEIESANDFLSERISSSVKVSSNC